MESIDELAARLKADVGKWEEEVFRWTSSLAREVAKALLESIDEESIRQKDGSLKVESLKWHRIITVFGDIAIKRTLYRDSNGRHCFLPDDKMGLDKGCQVSPKVLELAALISSHFPFQKSEYILRSILPTGVSHTSIHRLVGRVTDPYLEGEEKELKEVFADGVIPASEGGGSPVSVSGSRFAVSIWTTPESPLGPTPAGIDLRSWRHSLMVILDSHRPIVDSYDLETCRNELKEVLEEWIMLGISRHLPLPVVDEIELVVEEAV